MQVAIAQIKSSDREECGRPSNIYLQQNILEFWQYRAQYRADFP